MHNEVYRGGSSVAVMGDRRFWDRFAVGALVGRLLRRRPHDAVASLVAGIATGAIVVNALWFQSGTHPAPFFPTNWRPVANETTGSVTIPPPRPQSAVVEPPKADVPPARTAAQITSDVQRELSRRKFYDGPVDGVYGAKTDAAIREFEHAAGLKASVEPDEALLRNIVRSPLQSPPVPVPAANPKRGTTANAAPAASSKKVVALQRALADFGYGQLAPTGITDPQTKSAIERFERERKLPITGQVSERLLREVSAMTGRPLE